MSDIKFVRAPAEPGCDPSYQVLIDGYAHPRFEIQHAAYMGSRPYIVNEYSGEGESFCMTDRGCYRTLAEAKAVVLRLIAH